MHLTLIKFTRKNTHNKKTKNKKYEQIERHDKKLQK